MGCQARFGDGVDQDQTTQVVLSDLGSTLSDKEIKSQYAGILPLTAKLH